MGQRIEQSGIQFIDEQHLRLLAMIAEAKLRLKGNERDKWCGLLTLLGQLEAYTEFHFADEEKWMKEVGCLMLEGQQKSHQTFRNKVHEQISVLGNEDENMLYSIVDFVEHWLISHINVEVVVFRQYSE